jgi:hypothetical protein
MIAARDLKYAASVRENALLDVFDPSPVYADGNLILGFARHRAGVASDALAIIDYEAVFHARVQTLKNESQSYLGLPKSGDYIDETGSKRIELDRFSVAGSEASRTETPPPKRNPDEGAQ